MADAVTPPNIPHREHAIELSDGRLLGYAEFGDPEGVPMLWFHGTPGARKQVPPDAPVAARDAGVRLIGVERPGTGVSTPYQYARMIDWATDVRRFADELGLERFITIGLSGGGPFVLACAYAMPDRVVAGAVLGGIGPVRGDEKAPGYTTMLGPFEPLLSRVVTPLGVALTWAVRPLAGTVASPAFDLYARICPEADRPVLQRPEMKSAFIHDIRTAAAGGLRATTSDLLLFSRHWGFSLRDITIPIRFWQGDADGIVPFDHGVHQTALVPDSTLTVVPGGGHFSGYTTVHEVLETMLGLWADDGAQPGDVLAASADHDAPSSSSSDRSTMAADANGSSGAG